jgi:hypothetical protein
MYLLILQYFTPQIFDWTFRAINLNNFFFRKTNQLCIDYEK